MQPLPKHLLTALVAATALCGSAMALADESLPTPRDRLQAAQREALRVARLRDAGLGTVDYCSVVRLTDEPAPLAPDAREVTCHFNFGTTSLSELEAAGWEITSMTTQVNRNRWGVHTSTSSITLKKARPAEG